MKASKQITTLYKVAITFDELSFREVLYRVHNDPNVLVCGIPKV